MCRGCQSILFSQIPSQCGMLKVQCTLKSGQDLSLMLDLNTSLATDKKQAFDLFSFKSILFASL